MIGDYGAAMHGFCAGESSDEKIHEESHTAVRTRGEEHVQYFRVFRLANSKKPYQK